MPEEAEVTTSGSHFNSIGRGPDTKPLRPEFGGLNRLKQNVDMHVWMDVWMYGCMGVWMYECMGVWASWLLHCKNLRDSYTVRTLQCRSRPENHENENIFFN